jgi:hypothetical protein
MHLFEGLDMMSDKMAAADMDRSHNHVPVFNGHVKVKVKEVEGDG